MIKSMTGFGRYENVTNDYKVTVEIKSGKSQISGCKYQVAKEIWHV